MIETEIKFLADRSAMAQIQHYPIFAPVFAQGNGAGVEPPAAKTRNLETRYYDTADRILQRHGLSLRIRKSGRHYCQTLKFSGSNGAFGRHEWESRVAGFALELDRISAAELTGTPREILKSIRRDDLAPVFATKITRRSMSIRLPGAEIEAAFDEGVIEAGAQSMPVSEVELELKDGDGGSLYDLATQVAGWAPVALGMASKAQRGYALAFGTPPAARKASPSHLRKGASIDDAIGLMLGECLSQIIANYAVAQDGRDPEGVHQMRIGLRRLRAMLGLLREEIPAPDFQSFDLQAEALADLLAPVRGHDALRESIASGGDGDSLTEADRKALREAIDRSRKQACRRLKTALQDMRHAQFLLALAGWIARRGWRNELPPGKLDRLAEPAEKLAEGALGRMQRKAGKRARHFRRLPPRGRHRLRIALKKLRYAAIFFAPLYGYAQEAAEGHRGKATKRYLERVERLLDALGEDHDAMVAPPLLEEIGRHANSPAARRAIETLLTQQAQGIPKLMKRMRWRRRKWKAAPTFW
jgi:inorganic triphosphatase YgiF